jgi:hypothetical protein
MTSRRGRPKPRQKSMPGCGTRIILWTIALALIPAAAADVPVAQRAEVEHLITYLEHSDCVMLRNGREHDAREGAQHVRRKYDHYRDEIRTTEDFIARAATRSLVTGRAYRVRCPGQPERPAAGWLSDELAAYRDRAGAETD